MTLIATEVAGGFGFLEGPRFRDGFVYASDFYRRQVFRIDLNTGNATALCTVPESPSGLAFRDDDLYVVSMNDRQLLRLDDIGLVVEADLSNITHNPMNDMTVDARGRFYIGSFGCRPWLSLDIHLTPITRVDPDGSIHIASMDLTYPNGLAFDMSGTTLYVGDTFACQLAMFDVSDDGAITLLDVYKFAPHAHRNIAVAAATTDFLPDGIDIDPEGRVWVANAHAPSVGIYDPATRLAAVVEIENLQDNVYAVAFAPDGSLYACVAPRMNTWDQELQFPSRLVRLDWVGDEPDWPSLPWRISY